ncbi:MAG TPA: S8 family serine peptidase [Acidobacteriota bacterium]|nr:S8 family serine peptidase [Acidobacteriota bacterium]
MILTAGLVCWSLATAPAATAAGSSGPVPDAVIEAAASGRPIWAFLKDKGPDLLPTPSPASWVSPRAAWRMALRGGVYPAGIDRPIHDPYRAALANAGVEIRGASRWLNAIAGVALPADLEAIAALDFVESLRPVALFRRSLPETHEESPGLQKPQVTLVEDAYDYGPSRRQIAMIQVDRAHAAGFDGTGVRIGFLDSGFRINNGVFDSLRLVPGGTRDFINGDDDVDDNDEVQVQHGTKTLSLCAGFVPGELIGVAPRAEYAVGKVERMNEEIEIEEFDWIAGLEWLVDSIGCDLISSSVGYADWYEYSDFDGNTALATIAADLAAARGALVVAAVGNYECDPQFMNIIVPADGDSVLAVGAVTFEGERAWFSSCGPTSDGRVKPDVVAPGQSVRLAFPSGTIGTGNGTSFATPLVAGVCALVLQRRPELTPYELLEHIRNTASRPHEPLNTDGWGLVQAAVALALQRPVLQPIGPQTVAEGGHLEFGVTASDADGDAVHLFATDLPRRANFVDSGNGVGLFTFDPDYIQSGSDTVTIVATDYLLDAVEQVVITIGEVDMGSVVGLFEPWPNPADTCVNVAIPGAEVGDGSRLQVFTIAGGQVFETAFTDDSVATWRGETNGGGRAAAGVYLVRVTTPSREKLLKVAWRPKN